MTIKKEEIYKKFFDILALEITENEWKVKLTFQNLYSKPLYLYNINIYFVQISSQYHDCIQANDKKSSKNNFQFYVNGQIIN